MTTVFLSKKSVSLRSFLPPHQLTSGVMKSNNLTDNNGANSVHSHCEFSANNSPFFAPFSTVSQCLAPFRSDFFPLFPERGCVVDQPQQVRRYLDRRLTNFGSVKASQSELKRVKATKIYFLPLVCENFPFSIFHFPLDRFAAIREGAI